jgi:hypothetical protein
VNPVAPNQSKSHRTLRRFASSARMEPAVRRFLWEINAHWELVSLPLICRNIKEVLAAAQEKWDLDLVEWGMTSWPDVIDWIIKKELEIARAKGMAAGFARGFDQRGDHPLMGSGILRHPVYSTLCNSHPSQHENEKFRLLQAHLLFAHIKVTRRYTKLEEYEAYADQPALLEQKANPYQAALAVRFISKGSTPDLFAQLQTELAPKDFLDDLYSLSPSTEIDIRRYNHLVTFLSKGFLNAEQQKRGSDHRRGSASDRNRVHGGSTRWPLAAVSSDGPIGEGAKDNTRRGVHSTTSRKRHTGQEAEERVELDDSPEEDEEDEEIDRTGFDDADFQRSPGSFREVSAAQAMQIQMANQMFPWSYGTPTVAEIAPLIVQRSQEMAAIVSERTLTPIEAEELEILAFSQVMFWTSSSVEQARDLKLPNKTARGKDASLSLLSKTEEMLPQWRIKSPLPKYRRPLGDVPPGTDRMRVEYLQLPDVTNGSSLVFAFIEQRNRTRADESARGLRAIESGDQSVRVFRHTPAWYRGRLRALFEVVDKATRMTEGRLSRFLFSHVLATSGGDLSATAIITGNDVPLSRVKLFYACPSVSRLQSLYSTAVTDLRDQMWSSLGQTPPSHTTATLKKTARYIGNRRCPTRTALQTAIRTLKDEIYRSEKPTTVSEHKRHHNLVTLYTLWMFSYTTGVRGIGTPYIDLSEVDPGLRLTTLVDKDSGIGYKARLVQLTPALCKQMKVYRDFISRSPRIHLSPPMPCFFLDDKLKPIEVRPRTIVPIMNEFLPFPVNIHRRFISSELLDRGCPPEVVSAWMGHWHRGEEPWGKYSSFSFGDFARVLSTFLDPLLKDLGFGIVRPLSRPNSRGRK